jgi:hypothetical protein
MTLGNAAAAHVRLIVWCKACGHQVEPDPTQMARQYGSGTSVLDWRDRLVVLELREPSDRYGRHRDREASSSALTPRPTRAWRAPWRTFFGCRRSCRRRLGWRTRQLRPDSAQQPDPR